MEVNILGKFQRNEGHGAAVVSHTVTVNLGEVEKKDGNVLLTHFQVQIFPFMDLSSSCEQAYMTDISTWSAINYDIFRRYNVSNHQFNMNPVNQRTSPNKTCKPIVIPKTKTTYTIKKMPTSREAAVIVRTGIIILGKTAK